MQGYGGAGMALDTVSRNDALQCAGERKLIVEWYCIGFSKSVILRLDSCWRRPKSETAGVFPLPPSNSSNGIAGKGLNVFQY